MQINASWVYEEMDGTGGKQYILEEHLIIWAETGPYAEIGPRLLQMWKYDAHRPTSISAH